MKEEKLLTNLKLNKIKMVSKVIYSKILLDELMENGGID